MESSGITLFSLFYLNPHSFHYQDMLVLHQKITHQTTSHISSTSYSRPDLIISHLHSSVLCAVLSQFSCVQLFATLWTVAHMFLCPWDSPGKNTGVVAMPSSGDIPDPGVKPKSLNVSCIGSQVCLLFLFLPLMPPGKPLHDSDSLSFLIFIF